MGDNRTGGVLSRVMERCTVCCSIYFKVRTVFCSSFLKGSLYHPAVIARDGGLKSLTLCVIDLLFLTAYVEQCFCFLKSYFDTV